MTQSEVSEPETLSFHIEPYLPSQLTEARINELGLPDLLIQGYGIQESETDLQKRIQRSFVGDDARMINFFAINDLGKAIGALTYLRWQNRVGDKRGQPFAIKINELNETLAKKILVTPSLMAADVSDIVVIPEHRRKGVARLLTQKAVRSLDPTIIVGQTKSVAAVITRSQTLAELGYRTFYGIVETTPSSLNDNADIGSIRSAYMYARDEHPNEDGVWYPQGTNIMSPDIPDISKAPASIQIAFRPVINAQKRAGNTRIAVQSLISIKSEIFA